MAKRACASSLREGRGYWLINSRIPQSVQWREMESQEGRHTRTLHVQSATASRVRSAPAHLPHAAVSPSGLTSVLPSSGF